MENYPLPGRDFRRPENPLGWAWALRRHYPEWYRVAPRTQAHPRPWPPGFDPQRNPVFSYNEILIPQAAPAQVFHLLTAARAWPEFYPNASDVELPGLHLESGTHFRWRTFATRQRSQVLLFVENAALGWTAESPGTHAFHRWLLAAEGDGTRLVTEECQHGWAARLDYWVMNPSLHAAHQLWLEQIKRQCA